MDAKPPNYNGGLLSDIIFAVRPVLDYYHGPWIAGGAARKFLTGDQLGHSDIDIFVRDQEQFTKVVEFLGVHPRFTKVRMARNGTHTWSCEPNVIIQIIGPSFFARDLSSLFLSFDYTVCQFATDGRWVYHTPEAYNDLTTKSLKLIAGGRASLAPHKRLMKYTAAGFTPEPWLVSHSMKFEDKKRVSDDCTIDSADLY